MELPRYEYDYTTTLNGTSVRLYAFDGGGTHPVHGAYYAGDQTWIPCAWTLGGMLDTKRQTQLDLVIRFDHDPEEDDAA